MKQILSLTIILSGLLIMSCGKDSSETTNDTQSITPNIETNTPANNNTSTPTAGVEHYTCPNGHVGGGGAAQGFCTECNTALIHNQAFHGQTQTNPAQTNPAQTNPAQTPPPPPPTPAQNANGVWHYTCASGHAGGGGSAGPCGECGATLVHNQAYHN